MATRTIAATGGNWSSTTSWQEGVVPTAADDVVATALSGALTLDVTGNARSVDFTNYTSTFNMSAQTLNIGTSTANGTTALLLVAGMTFTASLSSVINFVSTAATTLNITTAGKSMPATVFNGVGGSWQLADAFDSSANGTVTVTNGSFSTNAKALTAVGFSSSNSNTRTVNISGSTVTVTGGGTAWDTGTSTNLTLTFNTSSVIAATGGTTTVNTGGKTVNDVTFSGSGQPTLAATSSMRNLTYNGTLKTDTLLLGGNPTVTGTLTLTGPSLANRLFVRSNVAGIARTITAAAVSVARADFMDVAGAGAAAPFTGTSLGDMGGNSGITFDTPTTQTWQGTSGGNWSDITKWTSRVPLPQDTVIVNAAFTASQTITLDMVRTGSVDFTGVTGSPAWTWSGSNAAQGYWINGSLTLAAGLGTITSGGFQLVLSGRGTHTLTTAGKSIPGAGTTVVIQGPGGTYTLQDDLTFAASFQLNAGTFDDGNRNLSAFAFVSNATTTRTWRFGTGIYDVTASTGSATVWNFPNTTGITIVGTPNLRTAASVSAGITRTIINSSLVTFASVTLRSNVTTTFTFTNPAGNYSLGNLIVTLTGGTGTTINLPAAATITVASLAVSGTSSANRLTIKSATGGSPVTVNATGPLEADWLSVQDVTRTGSQLLAVDSTDVSGNSGVTFLPPSKQPQHETADLTVGTQRPGFAAAVRGSRW